MKRIYRSRQDRMVCGVCGGIAEYFDLDPSLVRLGWIIFSAMGGSGLYYCRNSNSQQIKAKASSQENSLLLFW